MSWRTPTCRPTQSPGTVDAKSPLGGFQIKKAKTEAELTEIARLRADLDQKMLTMA